MGHAVHIGTMKMLLRVHSIYGELLSSHICQVNSATVTYTLPSTIVTDGNRDV
jgi:hypothetical protein